MKQKLIALALILGLMVPALVSAQGPVERVRSRLMEVKDRFASSTERKIDVRSAIDVRRASTTAARVELQQDIAERKAEQASKVMAATIERLENIVERVASRIEKIKNNGGDTADSEAAIEEAKNHLSQAKESLRAFSSIDLSAGTLRENWERIRGVASEVKTNIRAAHQSLMEAVRALKNN